MPRQHLHPEVVLDRSSSVPLHVQISDQCRQAIIRRRPRPGTRFISERRMAAHLGVNRNTVHQAFETLLSEGLLSVAGTRGSGLIISREILSHCRTNFPFLNFVLPLKMSEQLAISNRRSLEKIGGVMDRAAELHISVNILSLPSPFLPAAQISQWLDSFVPDSLGVIVLGRRDEPDPVFEALLDCDFLPQVFMDGMSDRAHVSTVAADTTEGAQNMAIELLRRGHRRLGIIDKDFKKGVFDYCARGRCESIAATAAAEGLTTRLVKIGLQPTPDDIAAVLDGFFSSDWRPTALFCHNDALAFQVEAELLRRGLHVPDDISLIGYDDIDSSQRLSTINHSRFTMSAETVNIIAELSRTGYAGDALHRTVPTQFFLRPSIGPAKDIPVSA
ncbi:MAG: substrate-binding domain-containing protein [Lentisphaerae bacterium]|jgi:DNA-binding LacI/PurR family transcriptional regulator/DNA-binding transcriptional regulator YhcF (GntR family)|nr:substrate-binding domain-containing protein [Lentisphaerota bacterium]